MRKTIFVLLAAFCACPFFAQGQEPADSALFARSREKMFRLAKEYAAFSDLSPRRQRSIMQDSGYRDLFIIKLRKGRGYYLTQPFKMPEKDRYALLSKYAYYVSATVTFNNALTDDFLFEPFVSVRNVNRRRFDFEVAGGYFVENNTALGVRFGYGLNDSRMTLESPIFELTSDTKNMVFNNVTTAFRAGVFTKNFIPLDRNQQIFIVNETNLSYTYEYSLSRDRFKEGTEIHKAEQRRHLVGIGVTPGVMYFLTPRLSLEFLISPLFVFYERRTIRNDELEQGSMSGGGLNFVLTPLKMNFGVSYFFGLNYKKDTSIGVY